MRARTRRDDRGVSAILVAMLLSSMMVMSAFATDLGRAYAERRHDQNTVDAAVMSAMVEGVLGGGVINDIVAEVRDKVDTTLGRTVTDAEWAACNDAEQLPHSARDLQYGNPTISPVTDCISFSVAFDVVRVRLPKQTVPGVFGPALGFSPIQVDAGANAKIVNGAGSGAPPFVALATATQGDFVCLRTSSPGEPLPPMRGNGPGVPATPGDAANPNHADPCNSAVYSTSSENFGTLLPWRYESGCTRIGNTSTETAVSIGIDHIIGFYPPRDRDGDGDLEGYLPGDPERRDGGAGCTVAYPNTFELDSGFNAGGLRCSLISNSNSTDCNGVDPRLHQGPWVQTTYTFVGEKMDNEPPWAFLRPAQDLHDEFADEACVAVAASRATDNFVLNTSDGYSTYANEPDITWDHYDRFEALTECVTDWDDSDPVLFEQELGRSPRFSFIPQVYESSLSGIDWVHIEGFRPSFMYRMYTKSASTMCDPADGRSTAFATHDAGQAFSCGPNNSNAKVDRLASIIFSCGQMPDTLCNKETGAPADSGLDIYEFRLVK